MSPLVNSGPMSRVQTGLSNTLPAFPAATKEAQRPTTLDQEPRTKSCAPARTRNEHPRLDAGQSGWGRAKRLRGPFFFFPLGCCLKRGTPLLHSPNPTRGHLGLRCTPKRSEALFHPDQLLALATGALTRQPSLWGEAPKTPSAPLDRATLLTHILLRTSASKR